jgi:hypothetical protein
MVRPGSVGDTNSESEHCIQSSGTQQRSSRLLPQLHLIIHSVVTNSYQLWQLVSVTASVLFRANDLFAHAFHDFHQQSRRHLAADSRQRSSRVHGSFGSTSEAQPACGAAVCARPSASREHPPVSPISWPSMGSESAGQRAAGHGATLTRDADADAGENKQLRNPLAGTTQHMPAPPKHGRPR